MINDLRVIEDIDILFKFKIILFGAGTKGVETAKMLTGLGITPAYFCDSNTQKWESLIAGLKVLPLLQLKQLDNAEDILLIITTNEMRFTAEIINTITRLQLRTDKIFTMLALNLAITQNIYDLRISADARARYIEKYKYNMSGREDATKKVNAARQYFFDEYMRCVFRSRNSIGNILVLQPGKVGSIAIVNSLSAIGLSSSHLHYLSNCALTKLLNITEGFATEMQNAIIDQEMVKIITLFRDPISRIFSNFFALVAYHYKGGQLSPGESFIDMCVERLSQQYSILNENNIASESSFWPFWLEWYRTDFQFNWFDKELKGVFGIDVFTSPFNKEKGFSIIKQNNIEVLLLKNEKLNQLETIIGEFVGAPHFKIINTNESASRTDSFLYKNLKDTIKLPRKLFSRVYEGNPKMNHFYSEEELSAFWKKWENNIV